MPISLFSVPPNWVTCTEGNIEYLGYLEKGPRQERTFDLKALVDESHQTLKEHGEGGNP